MSSNDHLADILKKYLYGPQIDYICKKLDAFDIYAPTLEEVLIIHYLLAPI